MNNKPKVLIVDDKAENLVALETVLRDLDIEIVKANSGNEALKATLYHEFDLALLDIQMPEMDGYELASILRQEEKTSRLPFIFISAVYTDNLSLFRGYERGAFSFVTKPFEPEILINKVLFFIEVHQQEAELGHLYEDLKKKNAELEFINKELESFTYSVSHDLRSPLRAIEGYSNMLKEDHHANLDNSAKKILSRIDNNIVKMSNLIDSLLEFSKLGKKEIKKETIDMNSLVKDVVVELGINETSRKINLTVQTLPSGNGDAVLMKQVFINLVSNAIKYSGKKDTPAIEIGAKSENGENIYYVRDNGAGFDMKYINKLFGVFQRLHDYSDFEGTGIGLAIVNRIITRSDGKVWAEGEVDKGATFYFSLPAGNLLSTF